MDKPRTTVWILGDHLSLRWPAWLAEGGLNPGNARLLFIESSAKLRAPPASPQLVLSTIHHFMYGMRRVGF